MQLVFPGLQVLPDQVAHFPGRFRKNVLLGEHVGHGVHHGFLFFVARSPSAWSWARALIAKKIIKQNTKEAIFSCCSSLIGILFKDGLVGSSMKIMFPEFGSYGIFLHHRQVFYC